MAKEYIERDSAIKEFSNNGSIFVYGKQQCKAIVSRLNAIPAVDVVPVVRCGECRYAYDSVGGWCCSYGVCVDCIVREDFFCADGARMDGDGE